LAIFLTRPIGPGNGIVIVCYGGFHPACRCPSRPYCQHRAL